MKTNIYVDAFNLYYRALKGTPYRWLDLGQLCRRLLPSHQVHRIRYFTAILQPWRGNAREQRRQLTYLRALQTIPNLTIHFGQFRTDVRRRPLVLPVIGVGPRVKVWITQEKGSDVTHRLPRHHHQTSPVVSTPLRGNHRHIPSNPNDEIRDWGGPERPRHE